MKIQLSVAVFVAVFAATVLANPGGAPFPVNPIGDTDSTQRSIYFFFCWFWFGCNI